MTGKQFIIILTLVLFQAILSGCIETPSQEAQVVPLSQPAPRPLYYDEKAIYLMTGVLMYDSLKNSNELDKLIVSPEMQPAVDEYSLTLHHFMTAKFYNERYQENIDAYDYCYDNLKAGFTEAGNAINYRGCGIDLGGTCSRRIYDRQMAVCNKHIDDSLTDELSKWEELASGTHSLNNIFKLLPRDVYLNVRTMSDSEQRESGE